MADVSLTIIIPDASVQRIFDAIINMQNSSLYMGERTLPASEVAFTYLEKQAEESNKDFGERFFKTLGKQIVRISELKADSERFNSDLSTLTPPSESVPDEIFE